MAVGIKYRRRGTRRKHPFQEAETTTRGTCTLDQAAQQAALWPGGTFDGWLVGGIVGFIIKKRKAYFKLLAPGNIPESAEQAAVSAFAAYCSTLCN